MRRQADRQVAVEDVHDLDDDVASGPVGGHRERVALLDRHLDPSRGGHLTCAQRDEPVRELVQKLSPIQQAIDVGRAEDPGRRHGAGDGAGRPITRPSVRLVKPKRS